MSGYYPHYDCDAKQTYVYVSVRTGLIPVYALSTGQRGAPTPSTPRLLE